MSHNFVFTKVPLHKNTKLCIVFCWRKYNLNKQASYGVQRKHLDVRGFENADLVLFDTSSLNITFLSCESVGATAACCSWRLKLINKGYSSISL